MRTFDTLMYVSREAQERIASCESLTIVGRVYLFDTIDVIGRLAGMDRGYRSLGPPLRVPHGPGGHTTSWTSLSAKSSPLLLILGGIKKNGFPRFHFSNYQTYLYYRTEPMA